MITIIAIIYIVGLWGQGQGAVPAPPKLHWGVGEEPEFVGYDCSNAQKVRQVEYHDYNYCGILDTEVEAKNASITIVQDVDYKQHYGVKCSIKETRLVFDCGMFSHASPIQSMSRYNEPRAVSAKECKEAWKTGIFKNDRGFDMKVNKLGKSFLNYDNSGTTWIEGGKAYCSGEKVKTKAGRMDSANINVQIQLVVENITVLAKGGRLRVKQEMQELPCKEESKKCEVDDAAYVWEIEEGQQYLWRSASKRLLSDL